MRKIMEHLLALQKLQFDARKQGPALRAEVEKLRTAVPPPILAHFERLVARGKKGVALVRNGVCSECHLRITNGKLVELSAGNKICLCDNCDRYLYLSENEPAGLSATRTGPSLPVKRSSKKTVRHVA